MKQILLQPKFIFVLFTADSVSPNSPPGVLSPKEVDKSSLPPLVRRLSDNSQHLLLGAMAAAKTTARTRKIVIYVCAADSQGTRCIPCKKRGGNVYQGFKKIW